MQLIRLATVLLLLVSLVHVTPAAAEQDSGTWDIGEFDSCFGLTQEERERLLGTSMEAWARHYEYCCIKSGGRLSNHKCVAPSASSSSASATPLSIKPMQDRPSEGILKNACKRVNGIFGANAHGFACTKTNCDTKGGNCTVACVSQTCVAFTPSRLTRPVSLIGILQDGDNRARDEQTTGEPAQKAPDEPPVILY